MIDQADRRWMERAIELAELARGATAPNPMVGCVIVHDGERIAEGYHRRCGDDHGEVDALRGIDFRAEGATLYVNLEPCCHFGRTPPCTESILRSGASRVVVGGIDPNPKVHGKGVAALRQAGLRVDVGVLEDRCRALNEVYWVSVTEQRPFITLKAAVTLDGRTATRTGSSKWITGEAARDHARRLRAESQAILCGVGTILADDPRLTARLDGPAAERLSEPTRVVFDSRLRTPPAAKVLTRDAVPVLICSTEAALETEAAAALRGAGAELIACGGGERVDLRAALSELKRRELIDLYVEGGAQLHGAFVDAGLADKLLIYVAPKIFGGERAAPAIGGQGVAEALDARPLVPFRVRRLGEDVLLESRAVGGPAERWWREMEAEPTAGM